MASGVNRIRNPDFSDGKSRPNGWQWRSKGRCHWRRESPGEGAGGYVMAINCDDPAGSARYVQKVACKPGDFYRVEATVACDLAARDESSGFVLNAAPIRDTHAAGDCWVTPALHRSSQPIAIRTYLQAPKGVRRLEISVGIQNAAGLARIHHVRFIPILEPDQTSHILAIPAPPFQSPPPRSASTVCICAQDAENRPITGLLSAFFGERNIQTLPPRKLVKHCPKTDALLLPDSIPPPSIRSLRALKRLAVGRIVVISLPAFVKLAGDRLHVRRIEQDDDPICAKVVLANHTTHGFALLDTFPYAWPGKAVGSFVQNQFRKNREFQEFCARHGLATQLVSMCDRDATSDQPICLYKATDAGALFVLDIEPVEAAGSTFAEPVTAMHWLLAVLGQGGSGLGQYVEPIRKEVHLREVIREMGARFEGFVVHDADVPADEVSEQLVTLGREDQSYGLPFQPKPLILIRSGLVAGDVESFYAAMLWFKQLIRMPPYSCPYADALAARFRLAWIPFAAPWEARDGWRRTACPPHRPMSVETQEASLAAMIDVVSLPRNRIRLVLPSNQSPYRGFADWLPRLSAVFPAGRCFAPAVDDGESYCDRDRFVWRRVQPHVRVVVDGASFVDDVHHEVQAAGGVVLRLEVPGSDADFAAYSIPRTDLAATLLEQIVGLLYGLIAVNRHSSPVTFEGFSALAPGQALVIARDDPNYAQGSGQAGWPLKASSWARMSFRSIMPSPSQGERSPSAQTANEPKPSSVQRISLRSTTPS